MRVAILTAVESEYEILRSLFSKEAVGKIEERVNGAFYYELIPIKVENDSIDIVIGISRQGNVEASVSVNNIIQQFRPDLFFFAGTCGGIKDVKIGDTIIATNVFDLLRGKDSDKWHAKPSCSGMGEKNKGICISVMMAVNRGDLLPYYYSKTKNKIHMGDIGSSSAIIASKDSMVREIISTQYANIIAVEMEGYGFYQTLKVNGYHDGIMIRAVTDDACTKNQQQDDINQPAGMKKVYYVIIELIKRFISVKYPVTNYNPQSNLYLPDSINDLVDKDYLVTIPPQPVFAGFLSFDWTSRSQNVFHLGHAFFMHFVDELLKANQKVTIFVCSSNSNFRDMNLAKLDAYNKTLNKLKFSWQKCFDYKVQVIDIGESIRSIQYGKRSWESEAELYLNRVERNFTVLFNKNNLYMKALKKLEDWRINGKVDGDFLEALEENLEIHPSDIRGENGININEIYSISYILLKKPNWYTNEWMISFIDYFGTLLSRTDEMRGIVIIESKRNAYAWLGMSFLSKKMKRLFPPLLLFHVIPDIYGTRYMSTTKPEGCITIENYQNISSEMLDDKFMDAVGYLLKDDNREATITHIKELMQEFKQRLNI